MRTQYGANVYLVACHLHDEIEQTAHSSATKAVDYIVGKHVKLHDIAEEKLELLRDKGYAVLTPGDGILYIVQRLRVN